MELAASGVCVVDAEAAGLLVDRASPLAVVCGLLLQYPFATSGDMRALCNGATLGSCDVATVRPSKTCISGLPNDGTGAWRAGTPLPGDIATPPRAGICVRGEEGNLEWAGAGIKCVAIGCQWAPVADGHLSASLGASALEFAAEMLLNSPSRSPPARTCLGGGRCGPGADTFPRRGGPEIPLELLEVPV